MENESRQRSRRGRSLVARVIGVVIAAVVVGGGVFVGASIFGRGTRPAIGMAHVAESSGRPIVYYEGGAGEPVVLLASLARPASDFNELAAALGRVGFRTLAVESRGIGGSGGGGPLAKPTLHDFAGDVEAVLEASESGHRPRSTSLGTRLGIGSRGRSRPTSRRGCAACR